MKIPAAMAFAVLIQILTVNVSNAQSIPTLQPPPPKIVIDGNIKEWGDSLRYYDKENKINYAIANTKDTLYMAIRINDRSKQTRILKAGLTFSIDPKGKKKETFSITFPLNVQGTAAKIPAHTDDIGEITQQERDDLKREQLTILRGIRATGFKDIEDEMITTSNTYGIQTSVSYDDNEYLVCEAAIPLSLFHIDGLAKNEWAFNFKINGLTRPNTTMEGTDEGSGNHGGRGSGGRGGGGMGGGGGRGGRGGGKNDQSSPANQGSGVLFKTEDFWEKFYLAK